MDKFNPIKLDFKQLLEKIGEIGYVDQILSAVVYVSGLPGAMPEEVVLFETGEVGQVLSLSRDYIEVLIFSKNPIKVGTRVARTNEVISIPVGPELLGKTIDAFGRSILDGKIIAQSEVRPMNNEPLGISKRKRIDKFCTSGVSMVDMVIPLGEGQRELIIGDRKTGKSSFVLQLMLEQARLGKICIYAAIGKRKIDIKKIEEYFLHNKVMQNIIILASSSSEAPGMIYLSPYAAMTIAEYFKDQGKDVVLVLDDLSTHAKFYRELSLLGKRFPGRNSYPGDIFYTHSRLLERAGNFITPDGGHSITCLPIAETAQGDLSGYIQTNLMSMTDGHIYFDIDLFSRGRRPAINPFLSVTRVGRQTQSNVKRDVTRELISFLTLFEKMQNFVHFGAELNDSTRATIATGERIIHFFNQESTNVIPINVQLVLFTLLWSENWNNKTNEQIKEDISRLSDNYQKKESTRRKIDDLVEKADSFNSLLAIIHKQPTTFLKYE